MLSRLHCDMPMQHLLGVQAPCRLQSQHAIKVPCIPLTDGGIKPTETSLARARPQTHGRWPGHGCNLYKDSNEAPKGSAVVPHLKLGRLLEIGLSGRRLECLTFMHRV